jgi:hypothetical protein
MRLQGCLVAVWRFGYVLSVLEINEAEQKYTKIKPHEPERTAGAKRIAILPERCFSKTSAEAFLGDYCRSGLDVCARQKLCIVVDSQGFQLRAVDWDI